MKNKVNYIEAMSFINLISYTARQWKLKKKITQNTNKWDCDFLRYILMAEFYLY